MPCSSPSWCLPRSFSLCLPPFLPWCTAPATFAPMLLLPEKTMAAINNLLVLAALASFLAIISFGLPTVDTAILQLPETLPPLSTVAPPIPVFLLTLVFHNVIPTVSRLLDYDPKAIRSAISLGSVVPFLLFLLYNFTILGNVGVVADLGAAAASSLDPIAILQSRAGDNPLLPTLVEGFCLLAITTSLVGFVEGLKTIYNPMFSGESGIFPAAVVENKERAIGRRDRGSSRRRRLLRPGHIPPSLGVRSGCTASPAFSSSFRRSWRARFERAAILGARSVPRSTASTKGGSFLGPGEWSWRDCWEWRGLP